MLQTAFFPSSTNTGVMPPSMHFLTHADPCPRVSRRTWSRRSNVDWVESAAPQHCSKGDDERNKNTCASQDPPGSLNVVLDMMLQRTSCTSLTRGIRRRQSRVLSGFMRAAGVCAVLRHSSKRFNIGLTRLRTAHQIGGFGEEARSPLPDRVQDVAISRAGKSFGVAVDEQFG